MNKWEIQKVGYAPSCNKIQLKYSEFETTTQELS